MTFLFCNVKTKNRRTVLQSVKNTSKWGPWAYNRPDFNRILLNFRLFLKLGVPIRLGTRGKNSQAKCYKTSNCDRIRHEGESSLARASSDPPEAEHLVTRFLSYFSLTTLKTVLKFVNFPAVALAL